MIQNEQSELQASDFLAWSDNPKLYKGTASGELCS